MSRSRHGSAPLPQRTRENSVREISFSRMRHADRKRLKGLGLKQFYGEELDRELSKIQEEVENLEEGSEFIRLRISEESFLDSDNEISNSIERGMDRAHAIRTLLLDYKKDGRSCKAISYNDVLRNFIASVQVLENVMHEYEKQMYEVFNRPDQVMVVRQIGDTHYLIRENPLEKYGYARKEDRDAKLEELHISIAQLKAMLVGLEFLAYSADKCDT